MSKVDRLDWCFALGSKHFLGKKEHDTNDTANTSGYLIISIATCSLMTPITYLAHRSGTYRVKWNVLPVNLTEKKGHRRERDSRRGSSTTLTGTIFRFKRAALLHAVISQNKLDYLNIYLYFGYWKYVKSWFSSAIFPPLHSAFL